MKSKPDDKIAGRPLLVNQQTLAGKEFADVLFLGDIHYGSPQCDIKRLQVNIDWCLKNRVYVFLMGDLIECATRESVGAGVYEQEFPAQQQTEEIIDYLQPLADAGLIIGSLEGNHERRAYNLSGVNIAKLIAKALKVPFLGEAGWNMWHVNGEIYTIYTIHGSTGAQKQGTVLNALENISNNFHCDLIAVGHSHRAINSIKLVEMVDTRSRILKQFKKFLVVTGSYLQYHGGYAQSKGLSMDKLGSPKCRFYATKHDISISW
jgi:predicted phosphodiesterase